MTGRGVGGCLSILRWSRKTSIKETFVQRPEGSKEANNVHILGKSLLGEGEQGS